MEHSVQFYDDDDVLLEGLGRLIGAALGAGDTAVVIATGSHRRELAKLLAARGLPTTEEPFASRYIALDAGETLDAFLEDGAPSRELFLAHVGVLVERVTSEARAAGQRVTAYGEMVAVLQAAGNTQGAIRLEELWNDLGERHEFFLHCAYPSALFGLGHAAEIAALCGPHSRVIPSESFIANLRVYGADR